jgi:hypothetical protein
VERRIKISPVLDQGDIGVGSGGGYNQLTELPFFVNMSLKNPVLQP